MSEAELLAGDDAVHGEAAYVLGPCEAHDPLLGDHFMKRMETGPGELSLGGVMVGQDPQAETHKEKSSGSGSHDHKTN